MAQENRSRKGLRKNGGGVLTSASWSAVTYQS